MRRNAHRCIETQAQLPPSVTPIMTCEGSGVRPLELRRELVANMKPVIALNWFAPRRKTIPLFATVFANVN